MNGLFVICLLKVDLVLVFVDLYDELIEFVSRVIASCVRYVELFLFFVKLMIKVNGVCKCSLEGEIVGVFMFVYL